jgi:hypothetical protein
MDLYLHLSSESLVTYVTHRRTYYFAYSCLLIVNPDFTTIPRDIFSLFTIFFFNIKTMVLYPRHSLKNACSIST